MSREQQNFEGMMKELESIVQKLNDETVSLEESLDLYRRGMKLSSACDKTLKDAENRVNQLIKGEAEDEDDVKETNE